MRICFVAQLSSQSHEEYNLSNETGLCACDQKGDCADPSHTTAWLDCRDPSVQAAGEAAFKSKGVALSWRCDGGEGALPREGFSVLVGKTSSSSEMCLGWSELGSDDSLGLQEPLRGTPLLVEG